MIDSIDLTDLPHVSIEDNTFMIEARNRFYNISRQASPTFVATLEQADALYTYFKEWLLAKGQPPIPLNDEATGGILLFGIPVLIKDPPILTT